MIALTNGNVIIDDPEWIERTTGEELQRQQGEINVLDRVDKTTLVFGIFFIDKYVVDIDQDLTNIHKQLDDLLRVWSSEFPWNVYYGFHIKKVVTSEGLKYILGSLCVDDNAEIEESLAIGLLTHFSRRTKNDKMFIKILDSEGDPLITECHATIPAEYEYPVATNRLWLVNGTFLLIPREIYYPNRGLSFDESLDFVERAYFKCIKVDGITNILDRKYDASFLDQFLRDNLSQVEMNFDQEEHYDLLMKSPKLFTSAIKNAYLNRIMPEDCFSDHKEQADENAHFELKLPTTNTYCDVLTLLLSPDHLNPHNLAKNIGSIITRSLSDMIRSGGLVLQSADETGPYSKSSSALEFGEIPDFKPNNDFLNNTENDKNTDNMLNQLNEYLESSQPEETDSQQPSDDPDEDDQAKSYFTNEGIDVDEDDFFEFFLKEALKMKENEISQLTSTKKVPEEPVEDNDDDLVDENDEELEALMQTIISTDGQNSGNGLDDLISSLKIDGSLNGPLQSILNNLGSDLND